MVREGEIRMVKEGGRGYKNGEGRKEKGLSLICQMTSEDIKHQLNNKEKGGGEIRMVREGEKKRGGGGGIRMVRGGEKGRGDKNGEGRGGGR